MSRYELAELEADMQALADAELEGQEEIPDETDNAAMKKDPRYQKFMNKMVQLCRLRHGVIKRYFEANKYKRAARNDIIKQAEETEEAIAEIMGSRHVHFMDAHPEIREFMEQVNKDEG